MAWILCNGKKEMKISKMSATGAGGNSDHSYLHTWLDCTDYKKLTINGFSLPLTNRGYGIVRANGTNLATFEQSTTTPINVNVKNYNEVEIILEMTGAGTVYVENVVLS